VPAYYATGSTLASMGKYGEAADCFRVAIRHQNDYADAYYFLALMMIQSQRAPEAVEPFHQALKLGIKPEFAAQAHNHLGMHFVSQGKQENALAEFRAAANADANLTAAQKNLGVALVRAGLKQEALEHFRRVLAATPQDHEVIREMQRLSARVGAR
jgi:protein O-GlcNAc transferase